MMDHGFDRGALYSRKNDIHEVYGGQQQSGIIMSAARQ